jgi:TRAP-type transport system periplasmic protein
MLRFVLTVFLALGALGGVALAADQPFLMKLSTATLNDVQHEWMKRFQAAVEHDSGGRIKVELYPSSQLGVTPRQIEGVQFGAIQGVVLPPEFLVGIDERFELMSASGLFTSPELAIHVTADPAFRSAFLALGANKGLVGVGFFISAPTSILTRKPARHLDDFKGLKIRVLASRFQNEEIKRLGASPVALALSDVMPAVQQGTIDGALAAVTTFTPLHYYDAAKYLTETAHYFVFCVTELSAKWMATLPPDLKKVIETDAVAADRAVTPWQLDYIAEQRKDWIAHGGELISLPPDEQKQMMTRLASVGADLTKDKPEQRALYEQLLAALQRAK